MSYSRRLEKRIKEDALQAVPRRVQLLQASLAINELDNPPDKVPMQSIRELEYLEDITETDRGQRRGTPRQRATALAERFPESARPSSTAMDSTVTSNVAAFLRPGPQSPGAARRGAEASKSNRGNDATGASGGSEREADNRPAEAEDAVRLMAVEGRLMGELSRFPILSIPGTGTAMVVRAWDEEEDEAERERHRVTILEVNQCAANLVELQRMVHDQVVEDQDMLDRVEEDLASAKEDIAAGVECLSDTAQMRRASLGRLIPSVVGLVLGGLTVAGASSAAATGGVPAACTYIIVRAVVVAGATAMTKKGTRRISEWHRGILESMKAQLPQVSRSLALEQLDQLQAAGDEAERRLVHKLDDQSAWTRHLFGQRLQSLDGSMELFSRPSDARASGHAYRASFSSKLPTRQVFEVIRGMGAAGSLDPNCEVCWSRPLDSDGRTLVRYLLFNKNLLWNRDFFCISRCGQVRSQGGREQEQFVFAATSLSEGFLSLHTGMPCPSSDFVHGRIFICGIRVSSCIGGGCRVEVMADVDSNTGAPSPIADSEVHLHVVKTAKSLKRELAGEAPTVSKAAESPMVAEELAEDEICPSRSLPSQQ